MNSVGAFVARDAELYTERRELCGMCASYAALDLRGLLSPVAGCNDFVLFLVIVRRDLFLPIMLPRGETRAHPTVCAHISYTLHYEQWVFVCALRSLELPLFLPPSPPPLSYFFQSRDGCRSPF